MSFVLQLTNLLDRNGPFGIRRRYHAHIRMPVQRDQRTGTTSPAGTSCDFLDLAKHCLRQSACQRSLAHARLTDKKIGVEKAAPQ
jgi:hypothetical protein